MTGKTLPTTEYLWSWRISRGYFFETDEEIDYLEDQYWAWKRWRDEVYGWWSERKWAVEMGLIKPVAPRDGTRIDAKALRELVTLSEVIRQFTPLRRAAEGQWNGKCPFHEDRLASLSVTDSKGLWHCFAGCGAGDCYGFLMKIGKVDFKTALGLIHKFHTYGGGL